MLSTADQHVEVFASLASILDLQACNGMHFSLSFSTKSSVCGFLLSLVAHHVADATCRTDTLDY